MMVLVIGGSGSGKSAWAEGRCMGLGGSLRYIATMRPFGADAQARIERHHALRAGKGFETLECYGDLAQCASDVASCTVLIECAGNALANAMFSGNEGGASSASEAASQVLRGMLACASAAEHTVVVTNDVSGDGVVYDEETMRYVAGLAQLNRLLAQKADEVVEVVCGIPVYVKGGAR